MIDRLVLCVGPQGGKAARNFVLACCALHDTELLGDAQLLVSELVTNALRHGSDVCLSL